MSNPVSVSVIGPGALGSAIIDLVFRNSGFLLHTVWGRTSSDCYRIDESGKKQPVSRGFPTLDKDIGRLLIISVPDDQISKVANNLSQTDINWSSRQVIHLSGSLDNTILQPLSGKGATTGSLHPLQTFTRGDTADRFHGIWFSLQGDESIFPVLRDLIKPTGGHSKVFSSSQKSAMHLAAVFASNYLVALMDVADQIAGEEGINDGLKILEPIVQQTLDNIYSKGSKQSLSGPVARGDRSTIEKHLNQLQENPGQLRLYCELGLIASNIAEEAGRLSETRSKIIRDILKSGLNADE